MNAPLAGIRVIEFCRGAAGAYCGMLLADMGADVIMVDDPVDDFPNANDTPLDTPQGMPTQAGLRRNKRSVALDLTTAEGRSLAHTLVRGAQVVIESQAPGAMARAGLGYEALAVVQPHLVYASISAFGQDGPLASQAPADAPAVDAVRSLLGAGRLDTPPDMPVAELSAGLYAAFSVATALFAAHRTGQGVHIDVPMLGATLAIAALRAGEMAGHDVLTGLGQGAVHTGAEAAHRAAGAAPATASRFGGPSAPLPTFRAQDGYFGMDLDGEHHWRAICAVVHRVDLLDDPRFADARERARHQALLRDALEEVFVHDDRAVWLARLAAVGVPCTAISTYSRVVADPQLAYMGWMRPMVLPSGETTQTFGSPVRLNGRSPGIVRHPPAPGAHTGDILAELDVSPQSLRGNGK